MIKLRVDKGRKENEKQNRKQIMDIQTKAVDAKGT